MRGPSFGTPRTSKKSLHQETEIDLWPPILLRSIAIHLPFLSRYFCKSMPSWQKYIYIYMPERHWVVHILAILKVNRLATVLSKSHFYSREKHFKSQWVGHLKVNRLSTFGGHFWPPKVDNLLTFKVANPLTLWKRYVFPYFSLFGSFFWKTRTLIEKQTGTSVDNPLTFRNSQCFSFFFGCCCLIFLFLFFVFLAPFFDVFDSSSKKSSYVSMLETNKQTKKRRRPRKQERKEERKEEGKQERKKGKKANKNNFKKGSPRERNKDRNCRMK